jgi:putative nucleotidyltransferase with HDIG domain
MQESIEQRHLRLLAYFENNPMNREEALKIVDDYVSNINLKRHMLAVEAAVRDYAPEYGADPEVWSLAGLLHDFDWEIHPTLEQHPQDGAPILRERGVPEDIVQCILSHADHTGVQRETMMAKTLYACDEITGLIHAAGLVRPSKSLDDLTIKSVKKKWKDARFAAAINRDEIETAADEMGVDLWKHIAHVLASMQKIGPSLGFHTLQS